MNDIEDEIDRGSGEEEPRPTPPPTPRLRDNYPAMPEFDETPQLTPRKLGRDGVGVAPRDLSEIAGVVEYIDGRPYSFQPGPSHAESQQNRNAEGKEPSSFFDFESFRERQRERAAAEDDDDDDGLERLVRLQIAKDGELQDPAQIEIATYRIVANMRASRRRASMQALGDECGLNLQPYPLPLSLGNQQQQQRQQLMQEIPLPLRKRRASISQGSTEPQVPMTYNSRIAMYAHTAQDLLYGKGRGSVKTSDMQRYPPPNHDTNEINAGIYNMTVNDHHYRPGGRPDPVDMYKINYYTDVSSIKDSGEYEEARKAKAFFGYTAFIERDKAIKSLQQQQARGLLDGVRINGGRMEERPRGAIAWLTDEGQEIGGRLRADYLEEKAMEGKAAPTVWFSSKGDVRRRCSSGFGPSSPNPALAWTPRACALALRASRSNADFLSHRTTQTTTSTGRLRRVVQARPRIWRVPLVATDTNLRPLTPQPARKAHHQVSGLRRFHQDCIP